MSSWRINTLFDNRSGKSVASTGDGTGATVVRATRGTAKPTYFNTGESQKIIALLGLPTSSNPELLEAIEYNNSYPIWISAPSSNGRIGGVLLSSAGSESLGAGVEVAPSSLASVKLFEEVGEGDDTTVAFSFTVARSDEYVNQSIDIVVNGVSLDVASTDAATEALIGTGVSGTYVRATGLVDLLFTSAPSDGDTIEVSYDTNLSSYYGLFLSASPAAEYLGFLATYDSNAETFSGKIYLKSTSGSWTEIEESPVEFSFVTDKENGFGINVHVDNAFKDSNYLIPISSGGTTVTSFTDDTAVVALDGGTRGDTVDGTTLALGWDYFQSTRLYSVDVFFDATADTAIPAKFNTLRNTYHKYSKFILPTPNASVATTLAWTLPVANRGVAFYYGWFEIKNLYNKTGNVISTPIGEVAKNVADIVVQAFGGIAPAWINENGLGGQLTGGRIVRSLYDPSEAQLQQLDTARINPIVLDPNYGPMILSRRTSISGLSDYSYVDYSGAIDYIVKNVVEQVLPYQIVKLNDSTHRNVVVNKVNAIVEPMTIAPRNVIRDYAIKCDDENNNDVVLAREEFKLDLAIKVTPKSRTITFTFINTPQTSSVEEQFV